MLQLIYERWSNPPLHQQNTRFVGHFFPWIPLNSLLLLDDTMEDLHQCLCRLINTQDILLPTVRGDKSRLRQTPTSPAVTDDRRERCEVDECEMEKRHKPQNQKPAQQLWDWATAQHTTPQPVRVACIKEESTHPHPSIHPVLQYGLSWTESGWNCSKGR